MLSETGEGNMSNQQVIQTQGLSKVYKSGKRDTVALDKLTLNVQKGEIFGYLGPNGAGKTTTIRLLLDLIRPTNGSATIFGQDVKANSVAIHKRLGFMPGELALWKNRTAQQVVNYVASVRGDVQAQVKEANVLADRLKFEMTKKVRDYSSGNRRKLGLIVAMMHNPDLLILDEPTNGLDPLIQQIFHEMMREVRAQGRTVFLSSHVLSEVQAICDRVGILRDGDLKAVEDVAKLTHVEFRNVEMTFRDAVPQAWLSSIQTIASASDVEVDGNTLKVRLTGDFDPLMRVVSDGYLRDMRISEPSLEEIFLTFYGNGETIRKAKETV